MIIEFGPRFTYYGREIRDRVDSGKLSLPGASRLLLGNTIELHSRTELQTIVVQRIISILEELCDEFYGTEKKDQRDFSDSLKAIIILVQNNLDDVIVGLNGEKSKTQELAGLFKMNYDLGESGVRKNGIFGTNTRIFIASCFRNERLSGFINDVSECLQVQSGQLPFQYMIKRFHYELARFASDSLHSFWEEDDLYQEGCIVLWKCVNKYSGQNFIPLRQYFLRSLKNKSIDMLRSMGTDKRKISLKTTSSSAESFNESQAHREVAKRYMNGYTEWLNSPDDDESNSFLAPSSVGEYFPETGKSITEAHVNKIVRNIFSNTVQELMLYVKTQIPEDHFKKLKEFFSHTHIEIVFLRFLFGNPREDRGLDIMQQDFLRTYMKGSMFFDGEKYCFQNLGDLQETFLMMCREIIEKDPMIQLAFSLKGTIHDIEVPF